MSSEALKAMYTALVDFVQTEYVNGPCEGGQSCEFVFEWRLVAQTCPNVSC